MANVQAQFEQFHKQIRTYYEINETLRDKKDIIVRRVKKHLEENNRPQYTEFIQGSYKMKVGVCAVDGLEYDIDVGLRFSFDESKHTPATVRGWVFEAVDGHTETVEQKPSCIRVTYADGYHVDLVPYAWWDDHNDQEQYRLAHESNGWRPADPPALVQHVQDARKPFADTKDIATQTDQFRRVVRYLKRWNDRAMPFESKDKPSGIALVLLTEQLLKSPKTNWDGISDDRAALEQVAQAAENNVGRISIAKPTPEHEDLFGGISAKGMTDLKRRFGELCKALVDSKNASDVPTACKRLREVFGDDFPCPDPDGGKQEEARKTSAPAVISSASSA
jgi:hypothetical protein